MATEQRSQVGGAAPTTSKVAYQPDKPPQTTVLVKLQSGDERRVDAEYAISE
jgi:hypothetical protein